jgi:hypothetical protein
MLGIWRSDGMSQSLVLPRFFSGRAYDPMTEIMAQRLVAMVLACGLGLSLAGCASTANPVADYWPHFAGGEPNDVPPRPGSPGYRAFIAHGQPQDAANTQDGGAPNQPGSVTPQFVSRQPGVSGQQVPAGTAATAPAQNPAGAPPPQGAPAQNVGQGGLY